MADPVTIGIMIAASTAMSAVGAMQQGAAAAAQGRAQQQAQQYNAAIKEQQATLARQQAGARQQQQRRGARQLLGQQRAALAQAGIGLGGSALDIEEQSAAMAELDSLTIAYEGELQAQGLLAAAKQDLYYGEVAAVRGKNAQTASYFSAGASILSGAASYGMYSGGGLSAATYSGAQAFPVSGGQSISVSPLR